MFKTIFFIKYISKEGRFFLRNTFYTTKSLRCLSQAHLSSIVQGIHICLQYTLALFRLTSPFPMSTRAFISPSQTHQFQSPFEIRWRKFPWVCPKFHPRFVLRSFWFPTRNVGGPRSLCWPFPLQFWLSSSEEPWVFVVHYQDQAPADFIGDHVRIVS